MKRILHIPCAVLCLLFSGQSFAAESIVPVGTTYVYSQNFNSLFTPAAAGNVAAAPAWTDNSTLPNWWFFHNTANAPNSGTLAGSNFAWFGTDGSAVVNMTLNSMGTASNTDRALAYPATTDRGEQAGIIVFQNPNAYSVDMTRIQYNGEVRRSNGSTGITESIFVWYQKAATQTAALTFTTAAATGAVFPSSVATAVNAYYIDNWTPINAARWTYAGGAPSTPLNLSFPIDSGTLSGIRLGPGQFMAVRFGNINDSGPDALMGIDDLSITFTRVNTAISATVSNVVRQTAATPTTPSDDTIEFILTVSGTGAVGPGWTIPSGAFANSGTYGVPKNFVNIPIAQFANPTHSASVNVTDTTSGSTDTFTVTAPWAALTPAYTNYTYSDAGTELNAADDFVTYTASVTGSFTGPAYTVTGFGPAQTINYGSGRPITTLPGAMETLTFTDSADATVTALLVINDAAIIGTNSLSGTPRKLLSLPHTGLRDWTLDSATRQARQTNSPANVNHEIRSAVVNLTSVGDVLVTASLDAIAGTSSGFEAVDIFRLDLIIDGNSASPISILGPADVNGNGTLEGHDTAAGAELPGYPAQNTIKVFNFQGIVPASAGSVQIRIVGSSNSASETYVVRDLNLSLAPPSLQAAAGTAARNHNGTDTPADDTIEVPVTITPVNLGASTAWASNLTSPDAPLSGLYSAPNPVLLSLTPPVLPATTRTLTLRDGLTPAVTAAPLIITPPAVVINATAENIVRQANGPGLADDTVTFDLTVQGAAGGPHFTLGVDVGSVTTADYTLTSTPAVHSVLLNPAPTSGAVVIAVRDASYPAAVVHVPVFMPAPAVPANQYVLGQKNLGAGLSDVVTAPGTPSASWHNYPGLRKTGYTAAGAAVVTISSEVLDLSGVSGSVQFTGTLRAVNRTTGFEAPDMFYAQLILDGNTAAPVNLISAWDADASGQMNGGANELSDEFNAAHQPGPYASTFALSYLIPDTVNSVQFIFRAGNDSTNESASVENVFIFQSSLDSDGDAIPDSYEIAYGLNPGSAADKFLDLDSDGQNNYQEYLAGTAANNHNSKLEFTVTSFNSATGAFSITWTSVPGKNYRVQSSATQAPGSWTDLTPNIAASAGSTTTLTGNLPGPLPGRSFFSVRVIP